MKKVRISRKNPNRILKAIQTRISPNRQLYRIQNSLKNSLNFHELRYSSNPKQPMKDNVMHSYRYKRSQPSIEFEKRRESYSPRQLVSFRSEERQKLDKKQKKTKNLVELFQRPAGKSPYLQQKTFNRSERRLIFGSRDFTQTGRIRNRHLRFNSSQEREKSDSLDAKKITQGGDVIAEAKNLMMAGESRKSMLVLRPILARDPGNLNALHIAAINLYNIGDYQKSSEYLEEIIRTNRNFNVSAYLLRAKIYLKQSKDVANALSKLEECLEIFPRSQLAQLEKGQIYLAVSEYKNALKCFNEAEKINPHSIIINQKLIEVYSGLKEHQKVLQCVQKLLKLNPMGTKKYHNEKVKALFELHQYEKVTKQYDRCDKSDVSTLYYFGYSLYKMKELLKSYLILETSLSNNDDCTKSIKLMLLILCLSNDFYEAYHLMERCQHLSVDKDQLKGQFLFIEGTVCLMKRNTYQGVQKLTKAKEVLLVLKDDFSEYSCAVINSFIAYGYFCLGNYQKSQSYYEVQLKQHHENIFDGMSYNMSLNKGFINYQQGKLKNSYKIFQEITSLDNKKIQPHFCLAIICINLYFEEKSKEQKSENEKHENYLNESKDIFKNYANLACKFNNNLGANFSYHKSILHSYLGEWRQAIITIDEAIEKSEENYWKYYYARALNMACVHNFSGAIDDCSAAINLKQEEAAPYYLRSCCFQIEGQGNYAFKDLQTYISLRPNDKEIHKFAGKLLFENGAFQDALAAFNHENVPETLQNEDVFLTKSKTYFLLGRFLDASQQMFKVQRINPERKEALFDGKMMQILQKLLNIDNREYEQVIDLIQKTYEQASPNFIKSQVFKKTQSHTLKAICYFYNENYTETIQQLGKAIIAKQKTIMKQSLIEGATREDEKDTRLYLNQMNYNISLCYFKMNNFEAANKYALKMNFYSNDPFCEPHQKYLRILQGKYKALPGHEEQVTKVEVFPNRNKISNFINDVKVQINNLTIYFKLCIPFPKVEPPQIFPKFDEKLIRQFNIDRIERKSQAPWICKQQNTIKFTSKMQKYSRLQIQESATEQSPTDNEIDNSHVSMDSIISRRKSKGSVALNHKLLKNPQNQLD